MDASEIDNNLLILKTIAQNDFIQLTFICSKSTIETLGNGVKYVKSYQ